MLDEPASAPDLVARRELLHEIALRTGKAGTTVLFSTHIVSDLERVASDIAFLHGGKLLLRCAVDDTKERYARLMAPRERRLRGAGIGAAQRTHRPAAVHSDHGRDGSALTATSVLMVTADKPPSVLARAVLGVMLLVMINMSADIGIVTPIAKLGAWAPRMQWIAVLIWLALIAWAAWRSIKAWRTLQHRPHPFLATSLQ